MSALERLVGSRAVRRSAAEVMRAYVLRHLQTLFFALGQLSRRPASTLMTTAVIGIALALPVTLHLLLANARAVTGQWDGATQISVFLKSNVTEARGRALTEQIGATSGVGAARFVSRGQALDEFRRLSGFGDALNALTDNPLPAVIVVQPAIAKNTPEAVAVLLRDLNARPEVDKAQLDMEWVQRLYALMDIARRAIWILAGLLALAVLLVVGNTIRLAIQNRRDEIVITKLIGGTDAFIRRPFLYSGIGFGLLGGIVALMLVSAAMWLLDGPVLTLAALYHSDFHLRGPGFTDIAVTLGAGVILGLSGSWLAVGQHLRDIEPT